MNNLFWAFAFSVVGNFIAWFHMQAQFKWEWARNWYWIILGGIPISVLFYWSTRWFYEYFGKYWYVSPVGFGLSKYLSDNNIKLQASVFKTNHKNSFVNEDDEFMNASFVVTLVF